MRLRKPNGDLAKEPRFPLKPLLEALGLPGDLAGGPLEARFAVNHSTAWKWRYHGVPYTRAVQVTAEADLDGADLWGDAWREAVETWSPQPHLPFRPLLQAAGIPEWTGEQAHDDNGTLIAPAGYINGAIGGNEGAATMFGISPRTYRRYLANGIPLWEADRLACHVAKRHPLEVWGRQWVWAVNQFDAKGEKVG